MDKRKKSTTTTALLTCWGVNNHKLAQPIDGLTSSLSLWLHEHTDGDHAAAIDAMLHLSCIIAMAGGIDPGELRDRFGEALAEYTKSVVVAVSTDPIGDA
jgi:hypothetical protein